MKLFPRHGGGPSRGSPRWAVQSVAAKLTIALIAVLACAPFIMVYHNHHFDPRGSLNGGLPSSYIPGAPSSSVVHSHSAASEGGGGSGGGYSGDGSVFTSDFNFPSVPERLRYYMGDWHNITLRPGDLPCGKIPASNSVVTRRPVLWGTSELGREVQTSSGWLVGSYLRDAHDVVNRTAADGYWILWIGDHHPLDGALPAASKTRFSKYAQERDAGAGGRPLFATIIWPFEMSRHYGPVAEYGRLRDGGGICDWEDKRPSLIWWGGAYSVELGYSDKRILKTYVEGAWRVRVVRECFGVNNSDVDVAFPRGSGTLRGMPAKFNMERQLVRESHIRACATS